MSSDGGGGGGAGGFFDQGDVEFGPAQGMVAAIEGVARDTLATERGKNTGYWDRRTTAAEAVQTRFELDAETSRGIAKNVQREMETVAAEVAGVPVREQDIITGVLEPLPFVSRLGEMLAEKAWDAGWDVGDPDVGQGFDTGGLPDLPGVESAGPGPDLVTPDVTVDAGTTDGGTTTDTGGGATAAPQPAPPTTPIAAVGAATSRARRRGRTATVATSTLGVTTAAPVARKTLLGA